MKINFNSIKVQLEQVISLLAYIKSVFQFHKGTIRTVYVEKKLSRTDNFNSIKVQLEHRSRYPFGMTYSDFNSIKVQLELNVTLHPIANTIFQFHKGTIRTLNHLQDDSCPYISIP